MRMLFTTTLVAALLCACSADTGQDERLEPEKRAALCLNDRIAGDVSDFTRLVRVQQFEGEHIAFIADIFWGEYYRTDDEPRLPMTTMVVATRLPETYFDAIRASPPRSDADYAVLRQRFGERADRQAFDLLRRQPVEFIDTDVARIKPVSPGVELPRQKYLVRSGEWTYMAISDGPPEGALSDAIDDLLDTIDGVADECKLQ